MSKLQESLMLTISMVDTEELSSNHDKVKELKEIMNNYSILLRLVSDFNPQLKLVKDMADTIQHYTVKIREMQVLQRKRELEESELNSVKFMEDNIKEMQENIQLVDPYGYYPILSANHQFIQKISDVLLDEYQECIKNNKIKTSAVLLSTINLVTRIELDLEEIVNYTEFK